MQNAPRRAKALVPLLILLALFAVAVLHPGVRTALSRASIRALITQAGVWAPLLVIVVMALAIVISPLPNVPIAAAVGMIYGPWVGTAIAVAGAIVGASVAFFIARVHGPRAIRALTGRDARFCDGCSTRTLVTLVFASRLIPVISFDAVSYGAGMSRMPFHHFFWASLVGMIPWTFFFTAVGATVLDNPVLATVLGVGLAAAVLLLPYAVKRWNPFGLRRIIMERGEPRDRGDHG